jgi:hypothetical protein
MAAVAQALLATAAELQTAGAKLVTVAALAPLAARMAAAVAAVAQQSTQVIPAGSVRLAASS